MLKRIPVIDICVIEIELLKTSGYYLDGSVCVKRR